MGLSNAWAVLLIGGMRAFGWCTEAEAMLEEQRAANLSDEGSKKVMDEARRAMKLSKLA